jgi:renalase
MPIAIVGAGMSGLSCAARLKALGCDIVLFDKGRGPAGRMASRRIPTVAGEADFDLGAQYFTVRHPSFAAQVEQWSAQGLARRWPAAGPDAWVGVPRMSAPLKALAADKAVRWNAFIGGVSRRADGWRLHVRDEEVGPFDVVVIALPADQATPLLALNAPEFGRRGLSAVSRPCWAGLFAFEQPLDCADSILRDRGVIEWAARNVVKPGRSGPEAWVVHADPRWSSAHLEDDADSVAEALLDHLFAATGSSPVRPLAAQAHRWRFARPPGNGQGFLWDAHIGLGACGDWLLAPRVESAWLSGFRLAEEIRRSSAERMGVAEDRAEFNPYTLV